MFSVVRKYTLLLAMFALASFASAQTPISGTFSVAGTPVSHGSVSFILQNCGGVPTAGNNEYSFTLDGSGALTGAVQGNSANGCLISAGANQSYFEVTLLDQAATLVWRRYFMVPVQAGVWNLATATPLSPLPAPLTNGVAGPAGPAGAPGAPGAAGSNGTNGTNGTSATVNIGTVSTLAAGQPATVTNSGTASAAVLNFGIPDGIPSLVPLLKVNQLELDSTVDSAGEGPELLGSSGWTLGSGWSGSFASGFTAVAGSGSLSLSVPTTIGAHYVLVLTITNPAPTAASSVCPTLGGSPSTLSGGCASGTTGGVTYTTGFQANDSTSGLILPASPTFSGTISSLSLKQVTSVAPSDLVGKDSLGNLAYEQRIGVSGSNNLFLGVGAGKSASSLVSSDTGVGDNSLASDFIGVGNTALGAYALNSSWGSNYTVAIGYGALRALTRSFSDTAVGANALSNCIGCVGTTAIGQNAGFNLTAAQYNILLGYNAGLSLTTGGSNILIGTIANGSASVDAPTPTTSGYLNMGNAITGTGVESSGFAAAIGIGKQLPSYSLDVNGTIRSTGLLDPAIPSVSPSISGTTTYAYQIVAYLADGTHTNPSPIQTITNGSSTLSLTSYNTISWSPVIGAAYYSVFQVLPSIRLVGFGPNGQVPGTATSVADNGGGTPLGSVPAGNNTSGIIINRSTNTAPLGSELLSSSGWTLNGGWTGTFGTGFSSTAGNAGTLVYPITTVVGAKYILSITTASTGGDGTVNSAVCASVGGASGLPSGCGGANGTTMALAFIATNTTSGLIIIPGTIFTGTISGLSLKRVTSTMTSGVTVLDSSLATTYEQRFSTAANGDVFLGLGAGQNSSVLVSRDTAVGSGALASEFSGSSNTAIGNNALNLSSSAYGNTAVGSAAMAFAITAAAYNNSVLGNNSLYSFNSGGGNVAVGSSAGQQLVTGDGNVLIGSAAGATLTAGSGNILIGNVPRYGQINTPTATTSNYINMGNAITCQGASQATIGALCGVGRLLPSYSWDVNGTIRSSGLTNPTAPTVTVHGLTGTTTYTYQVVAYLADGSHTTPSPVTTITNGYATLDKVNNYNTISWTAVPDASYYKIFMTSPSVNVVSVNYPWVTVQNDVGTYAAGTAPSGNNTWGLILGTSQLMTGVQGAGPNLMAASGTYVSGDLLKTGPDGSSIDSNVQAPNTSVATITAMPSTNITVACVGTCTAQHGRIRLVGASSVATGAIAQISFGTSYAATPFCKADQNSTTNGNTTTFGLGATGPLANGFFIANTIAISSATVEVDYICMP